MADIADKILVVSVVNYSAGISVAAVSRTDAAAPSRPHTAGTSKQAVSLAPSTNFEVSALQEQIRTLTEIVEELRVRTDRNQNRKQSRSRSRSRSRNLNGECFYHHRFGSKAKKCTAPCTVVPRKTTAIVVNRSGHRRLYPAEPPIHY